MKDRVIKAIFEDGPKKLMSKGLKYVEIYLETGIADYVWGNGRILGLFISEFTQFNSYAFGGIKVENYHFYLEDGVPLTHNSYSKWSLEYVYNMKEKYKSKLLGEDRVLLARDARDEKWYFIFPNGQRVEEAEGWEDEE